HWVYSAVQIVLSAHTHMPAGPIMHKDTSAQSLHESRSSTGIYTWMLVLCAVMVLALSGCGGDTGIEDTQFGNQQPLVDRQGRDLKNADAQQLYQAAHAYLINGQAEKALEVYARIQVRYPFSDYATQADIESITAHYLNDEFSEAVS